MAQTNKVILKFKDATANTISLTVGKGAITKESALANNAALIKEAMQALIQNGYGKLTTVKTENEDGTTTSSKEKRTANTAYSAQYVVTETETLIDPKATTDETV